VTFEDFATVPHAEEMAAIREQANCDEVMVGREMERVLRERNAIAADALPYYLTIAEGLALVDAHAEKLVADTVAEILEFLEAGLVPVRLRKAVIERESLVDWWPWPRHGHRPGAVLCALVAQSPSLPPEELLPGTWPGAVSYVAVAQWVAPVVKKHTPDDPDHAQTIIEMAQYGHPQFVHETRWISCAAMLYAAFQDVESDRRTPVIRHSADKAGRAALAVLGAGPGPRGELTGSTHPWKNIESIQGAGATVELVWDGRRTPVQLALDLGDDAATLDWVTVRGILAELHEDGLRDWLILHRMAGEQGGTGRLRWSWADHKERTPYAYKIQRGRSDDSELAGATVRRLWQLKRAEIRLYSPQTLSDGTTPWRRVGDYGLIDIPAGRDDLSASKDRLRLAAITINPAIYAGAKRQSVAANFMLLAESAVALPGDALRLLSLLACDWHYAREHSGIVREAATLWEYATIREGRRTPRKRWPEATRTLERILAKLAEDGHIADWKREDGDGAAAMYRIRPPRWWVDQVLLDVPPDFGKSLASTPKTGTELKGWRDARGWSRAEVARLAGVSESTIKRCERDPTKPLPVRLVGRLRPL
jgi:hypothetical protein